jgi:hypothetical protein
MECNPVRKWVLYNGTYAWHCLNHDFNKIKKIRRINKPEVSRCHPIRTRKMNLGNPDNRIGIVVQTMP